MPYNIPRRHTLCCHDYKPNKTCSQPSLTGSKGSLSGPVFACFVFMEATLPTGHVVSQDIGQGGHDLTFGHPSGVYLVGGHMESVQSPTYSGRLLHYVPPQRDFSIKQVLRSDNCIPPVFFRKRAP